MIATVTVNPAVDKVYFIDNFQAGSLYRVESAARTAGGKGINVARVISLLGEKAASVGFKAGETGRFIENELIKLGIRTCFIEVEGESRTNINIIDRSAGHETEVLELGPTITQAHIREFLEKFSELVRQCTVVTCSGGLAEGMGSDFYRTLVAIASDSGCKAILDSSGEVLEQGMKACPYMIKPNLREFRQLMGKEYNQLSDIVYDAKSIVDKGISVVLVSMGAEGAVLVSEHMVLHAVPPSVSIVNSIGSGDAMVGGIAIGCSKEWPLEEALRLGMASGLANAQLVQVGYVTTELVEKWNDKIIISRLDR